MIHGCLVLCSGLSSEMSVSAACMLQQCSGREDSESLMSDILSSAVDIYLDERCARNVYLLTRIIASHNHYRQSYIPFALITSADSHAVALRNDEAEREGGFSSAPIYVAAQRDSRGKYHTVLSGLQKTIGRLNVRCRGRKQARNHYSTQVTIACCTLSQVSR
jgi:hypothetical protein